MTRSAVSLHYLLMLESRDPLSLDDVLRAEREILRPASDDKSLTALCISGGGIRSATFSLGAIQGLAEQGLLKQFDYLSTVSGGGYIGGWLTAWINRAGGVANVIPQLCRDARQPLPGEADPIQHLREYNNYLAPRIGPLSGDTWTLVATVCRNVFLNWLVLIPLLMFGLMVPRLVLSIFRYAEYYQDQHGSADAISNSLLVSYGLPAAAGVLFALAMFNTLRYLPSVGGRRHCMGDFVRWCLIPLVFAAILFCTYQSLYFFGEYPIPTALLDVSMGMLTPCFSAWFLYLLLCPKTLRERLRLLAGPLSLAILLLGLGTAASAWVLANQLFDQTTWAQYVTIGPPLLLVGFGLAGALFAGLSSGALGDEDREWLARGASGMLLFCFLWLASCTLVLLAPEWVFAWHPWGKGAVAGAGAASGWASAFWGFWSPKGKGGPGENGNGSRIRAVLKVAPPAFVLVLGLGLAIATNWLLAATSSVTASWWNHDDVLEQTLWFVNASWMTLFLAVSWSMARYININQFSLQGMYRDRLIRAYLGASNARREANPFTGFSKTDNFFMRDLDPKLRPLHVINLCLNLVGGERLAWQQRKAESFTASALHCGSYRLGYRDSAHYGGRNGISLGTAITISGAAASPNMGYHSSPITSFIMTLFNVRLGSWLGNPGAAGAETWRLPGPRSAIRSLVSEAFGLTTDRSSYVYLSDGGHFENLGLYEMVLRRCRSIVVLDSSCDEDFTYEDLGNALRKIRIDLKVPITFSDAATKPLRAKVRRCAVATIHYSAVHPQSPDGTLIYIKPMLLGNEPPDVASYSKAHPTFPHQGTGDQFFDESQTESYRMLGLHTISEICDGWQGSTLDDLRKHIETRYLDTDPPQAARAARY